MNSIISLTLRDVLEILNLFRKSSSIYYSLNNFIHGFFGILGGVFLLEGKLNGFDSTVKLIFFGRKSLVGDLKVFFDDSLILDRVSFLEILKKIISNKEYLYKTFDFLVVQKNFNIFQSGNYYLIQTILEMCLESQSPFEDYLMKSISKRKRNNIRRALKNDFNCRISHNEDDLKAFYYDYLVPYSNNIFQENSSLPSFQLFSQKFRQSRLLILEENKKILGISYLLLSKSKESLRIWRQALPDYVYNDKKLKGEVTLFLDSKSIEYAIAEGFKKVSFGKSACLKENLGFWNKKSWGCKPEFDNNYPFCYLAPISETAVDIMKESPLIHFNKDDLKKKLEESSSIAVS